MAMMGKGACEKKKKKGKGTSEKPRIGEQEKKKTENNEDHFRDRCGRGGGKKKSQFSTGSNRRDFQQGGGGRGKDQKVAITRGKNPGKGGNAIQRKIGGKRGGVNNRTDATWLGGGGKGNLKFAKNADRRSKHIGLKQNYDPGKITVEVRHTFSIREKKGGISKLDRPEFSVKKKKSGWNE